MKSILPYILALVFFAGCQNEPEKEIENIEQEERINPFIGSWESIKRSYPYESDLIINMDGTYHFDYGACVAHGFSNGKWTMEDSIITLTSDDIDSCMYLGLFGVNCVVVDENDTAKHVLEKIISDCDPEPFLEYVQFTNEEFFILSDTLRHVVRRKKPCPDLKDDFVKAKKTPLDTTKAVPSQG